MAAMTQLYGRYDINTGAKSIRILDLKAIPGIADDDLHEPLQGSLRVVDLDTNPIYNALSYVWGDETADDPTIRIDDVDVRVTWNCYDALLQIRKRFGGTGIWVDAICISQADVQERSRQVALMGSIYRKARAVMIWLGTDERIDRCLLFLGACTRSTPQDLATNNLDDLVALLQHSWWHRAWTFQELVLARDPILLGGSHQLPWRQLGLVDFDKILMHIRSRLPIHESRETMDALVRLTRLFKVWRAASVSSFGSASHIRTLSAFCFVIEVLSVPYCVSLFWRESSLVLTLIFTLASASQLLLYYEAQSSALSSLLKKEAGNQQMSLPPWNTWQGTNWRMGLGDILVVRLSQACIRVPFLILTRIIWYGDLIDWPGVNKVAIAPSYREEVATAGIIQALRTRQCKEPVDHSFAMHGVLRTLNVQPTKANYAKAKQEVYYELFRDLLSWKWVSLTLLLDAGSPDPVIPSWAPIWDSHHRTSWLSENLAYPSEDSSAITQLRTTGFAVYKFCGTCLSVAGFQVASVVHCTLLPDIFDESTMKACVQAVLSWHWEMQFFGNRSKATSRRLLTSMVQIMQVDSEFSPDSAMTMAIEAALSNSEAISLIDRHTECARDAAKILDLIRSSPRSFYILNHLRRLCEPVCGKRSLLITEDGEIGTGPLWTKPGDIVHRISGLPLPMILRKQDKGDVYQVVGAAMTSHKQEQGFWWLRRLKRITLV